MSSGSWTPGGRGLCLVRPGSLPLRQLNLRAGFPPRCSGVAAARILPGLVTISEMISRQTREAAAEVRAVEIELPEIDEPADDLPSAAAPEPVRGFASLATAL
jgi:hypothetical protein